MHHAYSTRRHYADRSHRFSDDQFSDNEWNRDRTGIRNDHGPSNEYVDPAYERSNFRRYDQQGQSEQFEQRSGRLNYARSPRGGSSTYWGRDNAGSIDEGYWRSVGQAYDALYGSALYQGVPQRSRYARVGMSPRLYDGEAQSVGASYMSGQFMSPTAGLYRGKGPKGYSRSDERLRELICEALSEVPDIDASDITVTVQNAEVTLVGSIDNRRAKHAVEDLIERRTGAGEIHNHLRVKSRDFADAYQRQADAWWRN